MTTELTMTKLSATGRPAVFLDRDGTLIREVGYLSRPEQVELLPGAIEGLQQLQQCGYALVIVSNQSGVARGYFPESAVHVVHHHLLDLLESRGIHITGVYYCPHHPEGSVKKYRKPCRCRKPEPGMVEQAVRDLALDLSRSVIIGDKASDIELGKRLNIKTVLVLTGYGKETLRKMTREHAKPDYVCHTLAEAAQWICSETDRD